VLQAGPDASYFATRKWSEERTFGGQSALMTFWHRPLHAMTDAFTAAGLMPDHMARPLQGSR
jgi:hypothetical protein